MEDRQTTFEVAKLAMEKGFDHYGDNAYNEDGTQRISTSSSFYKPSKYPIQTSSQIDLQNYLSENFDIEIETFSVYYKDQKYFRVYVKSKGVVIYNPAQAQNIEMQYKTRSEALEVGLLHALISIKK
jgi:hypothetical protein